MLIIIPLVKKTGGRRKGGNTQTLIVDIKIFQKSGKLNAKS